MTGRDALCAFLEQRGIKATGESFQAYFRRNWMWMTVFGHRVPVKPLYGFKKVLVLHDLHHLLAGYDTSWTGEAEVAAWELGSGGCGSHLPFWFNRIGYLLFAAWFAPLRIWHAFRRGRTQRNLYRHDCADVLARDVEELRMWVTGATSRN